MRRSIAILLSAALLMMLVPWRASAATFTDLDGHWAQSQVESGVAAGYVSGYPDGTFRPDAPITRAEFFKLMAAATRLGPSSFQTGFAEQQGDAASQHWSFAQGYIPAAVGAGLVVPSDYGESFSPDTPIRRREILLAAVRALGQEPVVYVEHLSLNTPDAADYPEWLREYAALAVSDRILTGYADGSLGLDRTATRAEALVIVQRILSRITLSLVAYSGQAGTGVARHPAAGEPLWTWNDGSSRPTVSDSTNSYTFPFDIDQFRLLPTPGKAAWVRYAMGSEGGTVGRLAGGKLTEVAHYASAVPQLLAVGDDGALWFTDGANQLLTANPSGVATTVAGVNGPVRFGDIDWNGNFWGLTDRTLYRVTPDGQTTAYATGLGANPPILGFGIADDGAAWILLTGSYGNRLNAVRLENGVEVRQETLLGPYAGGSDQISLVGRSGPLLYVADQSAGQAEQIFRFDIGSGEFVREVLPSPVGTNVTALPAPGGGVLLRDSGGSLWRVLQ